MYNVYSMVRVLLLVLLRKRSLNLSGTFRRCQILAQFLLSYLFLADEGVEHWKLRILLGIR